MDCCQPELGQRHGRLLQNKKTKAWKWTKPPVQIADPRRNASTTNPTTWATYDDAMDAYSTGAVAGPGFVLTDQVPVTGIDLDHCRDIETGTVAPWARAIVTRLDSYTEVSPSGTGLRILVFGYLPGERCRKGHVELYDTERYLTIGSTKDDHDDGPDDSQRNDPSRRKYPGESIRPWS